MPQIAGAALSPQPPAAVAWFTDAVIENSSQTAKPADALPEAPGCIGNGVILTKPVAIDNPLLDQQNGLISFWIKPEWNGNDGKTHRLMRIGDPEKNGLLLEKTASGMLRYVMACPGKITVARSDVSNWRAGEWHQITVVWMSDGDNPVGIPLWIDKVAVDGPIGSGNTFLDPAKMADRRIWIGDATSDAVMDEMLMRNSFEFYIAKQNKREYNSQIALVYRDYFRTAPFTQIEINPDACYIPSDPRVVNGCQKQFGLNAKLEGKMVHVTDNAVGYGNWTDFDAKPFIKWSTSDEKIATVDTDGIVTGKSVGKCALTADFHGMKAAYDLEVITIEQPDLGMLYVERLPRYSSDGAKWWPDEGESVQSIAHIGNYGYETVPAGAVVRFELIPDSNGNFRADPDEAPIKTQNKILDKALKPGKEVDVSFDWNWTNDPTWVRVAIDPDNKVGELCEANNQRCDLNVARSFRMGYVEDVLKTDHANKKINLVGSFSYYDWITAQIDRFGLLMREAVYTTTSPVGVKEAARIDKYVAIPNAEGYSIDDDDSQYYDGNGLEPDGQSGNLLVVSSGLVHEYGHFCFNLPDLYGYPMSKENVLLKDEKGSYYSGGPLMPEFLGGGDGSWLFARKTLPMSTAMGTVPCSVGYRVLMGPSHMILSPLHAGRLQYFARYHGAKWWGVDGRLMPSLRNELRIYDINDKPLDGAAIYVYHVTNTNCNSAATKYFADRPKFIGSTDKDGLYIFPGQTDESWDDADTDQVDGAIDVWNPFGRVKTDTAFTPNVWSTEGLLLIKIVSGDQAELQWLPQTEFNNEFFRGNISRGIYTIRTSLRPSKKLTPIVRPTIPDAIKEKNLKPVAVCEPMEITLKCGEEFTLDGSKSYDPEGQPIFYRWAEHDYWIPCDFAGTPMFTFTAPDEPGDYECKFYVLDGLRVSESVTIKAHVVK